MLEFSSDKEFYGLYYQVRDNLVHLGWREGKATIIKRKISVMFTKDGYGMYVLFGCEGDIKDEIL